MITFRHFHYIWNCRLQTLSVWKSLKFVIWERVHSSFRPCFARAWLIWLIYRSESILKDVDNWQNAQLHHLQQSFLNRLRKPITRRQIVDSSKIERVCRRQFRIWRKWQQVIQTGRKHCGKRRNCSLRAISPFPTVFSKGLFPRGVKRCHCVGMGLNAPDVLLIVYFW